MLKKISQVVTLVILQASMVVMLAVAAPMPAQAGLFTNSVNEACGGAQLADNATCTDGNTQLEGIVKAALNILSVIAGIAAVIMIMVAGIRYITSGGDSSGISGAKNTIIYAIVGIAIVMLAQLIVKFVVGNLDV